MDQAPITENIPPTKPSNVDKKVPKRSYPGMYDSFFGEARSVLMFDAMDGFRAEIMKQVTPFFSITHGLMLGSAYFPREMGNSLYNLSIDCYRNGKSINATVDSTGRVAGRVIWPINKQYSAHFNALTSNMPGQDNVTGELHYKGSDFHTSIKAATGKVLSATYCQYITKDLKAGLEAIYNPIKAGISHSLSFKYIMDKSSIGCTLSSMKQMEAYYTHSPSKRTRFVSKLTVDFVQRASEMQVGCLYMFKSGKMYMSLTSSGHLQTYIEEYVTPTLVMTLSADHSIPANATRCGFGTKVMMG